METPSFQQRVLRLLLTRHGKHCGVTIFGAGSFVLGATLATVPYGEIYLVMLWALAIGILVVFWRD